MPTLRETFQADIATAEADLAAKKAKLAELEGTFSDVLGRDVDAIKAFFHSIGAHIFPKAIAAAPVASAPPAVTQLPTLPNA